MHIIDIPSEQTTAFTDIMLAVISFSIARMVYKTGNQNEPKKTAIWTWAFSLLGIGSIIASAAHGLQMSAAFNFILWQPINLSLGLMISLIIAGVFYDLNGRLPHAVLPVSLGLGVVFYAITIIIPGQFFVFILYEAVAMVFALISYGILSIRGNLSGAWYMALGILMSIVAAVIQATDSISLNFIWQFDHNGIFHLVQMLGMALLFKGLKASIKPQAAR
ncbi:MAG: hypothetical protein WCO63_06075 [Bacteroidota bacterium]